MRLRLKEDPSEWRKFALLCCGMVGVLAAVLYWRKWVPGSAFAAIGSVTLLIALLAWTRPEIFRGFYRVAMTVSFHIGQVLGKVILAVFYIFVLTPMGLVLRLIGKDLLEIRLDRKSKSYWKEARKTGRFDQQF